ncbi:MAG: 4Fe-4S dicluster domain-containing protein [Desulfobacterales bacterium]|uniref:4Fe-4S dicluster domain-containing protein n=1 Tax=Candidatus Desulfaltia bathyphila TaxID=2841697 RepID=A0A8J6TAA0_9BACT|nr:4Fe-4S dicluster domain-containing protein [Candidatus Desulfaltia bathyphila]MBL7195057.1 4Fe-4S dicluster domain-containing protein [Desulfobacterales bacterium]MBL7207118.1 4Fe-4S dicluster domain-containing protein [Desulfobacterales bacterium]
MEKVFLQKADPNFKDEIAKKIGLEEIKPCYSCGSCTGVCPVHEVIDDFDPRRIIHMIVLGMRREVLSSDLIWFCCLCNSCYFVCPQGIRFSRISTELQKMALAEGYVDEEFLKGLLPVNDFLQDLCRRTLFQKVKEGFHGSHVMPCWRKYTVKNG